MNRTTKELLGILKPIDHTKLRRERTARKRARKVVAKLKFATAPQVRQHRKPPKDARKAMKREAAIAGFNRQGALRLAAIPETTT